MTFRTRRLVAMGAAGVAAAAVLAGCSFTNPQTIATPYAASDGTNSEVTDPTSGETVRLRNFLVVAAAKDAPGAVVGAIANDGTKPVTVQFKVSAPPSGGSAAQPLGSGSVTVEPGQLAQVGPAGTALDLASVPTAPGTVLTIEATTPGGTATFPLPVVAAVRQYATLTPTATPSAAAS